MPLFKNNNRTNYKNKIILHFSGTLIILMAMVYFGVVQAMNEIEVMKERIDQEKLSLEKSYIRGQKLRELAENLKTVEPDLAKLDSVFIKKEMALDFITALEGIAEKNGISQKINLANANRGNVKSKEKNETIPIQLSSTGSFYKEMMYLASLESLNYYINVKNIEISNSSFRGSPSAGISGVEGAESESIVGIQILADTYWQN
jgi:Tfp pilus assembly protein PilO